MASFTVFNPGEEARSAWLAFARCLQPTKLTLASFCQQSRERKESLSHCYFKVRSFRHVKTVQPDYVVLTLNDCWGPSNRTLTSFCKCCWTECVMGKLVQSGDLMLFSDTCSWSLGLKQNGNGEWDQKQVSRDS